jgi:predicted TPR repeat methyltransferase
MAVGSAAATRSGRSIMRSTHHAGVRHGGAAKVGDRAAAAQEYLRILQIAPDQPEARRELARLGRAAGP